MAKEDIQTVYDTLPLRHQLGRCPPPLFHPSTERNLFFSARDSGALNNTKSWKKTTPVSFRSPYTVQADIGFFAQHKKTYGAFFCAVQTFTQKIFALPLKNTRSETLMEALGHMLKVSEGWEGGGRLL
jgi:hypothetical protein